MKSQSQYVIKGEKLYQNGEIIGNRKIHILDSNKLRVKNGKYVLTSLLLNKLKNKNIRIKKQLFINNQQTSNKYDETLEEEPSKKYTYELSEINTPNVEINTPYVEIETPYVEIDTSTVELHIPNVELHTPNAEIDTPNVEQYTPNVEIDTLKVVIDTNNVISQYSKTSSGGIIYITNIVLNTLCNDTSTSITRDIPFYNAFSFGTYLVLGKTYSLTVTICDINITYPAAIVSVWIDWNQTNSYNENDWIQVSNYIPIGESARVEFVVPMTAKLGTTGMRIRSRGASDGNKNGPKDAYVYMGSGDTQDYPITIVSEEL